MVSPITVSKRFRNRANGVFRGRNGLGVMKDNKMCTVRDVNEIDGLSHMSKLIVFPVEESHIKQFKQAAKGVRDNGPAAKNPGAVGTVFLRRMMDGPYFLYYAQAHYTTAKKGEDKKANLHRSLATKYGGWRQRAFRFATQIARDEGRELIVPRSAFFLAKTDPEKTQMYRDLKKVCDEEGLEISLRKTNDYVSNYYILPPKNR
jgi:hypothetical protein